MFCLHTKVIWGLVRWNEPEHHLVLIDHWAASQQVSEPMCLLSSLQWPGEW